MDNNRSNHSSDGETKVSWRIRIGTWMFCVPFAMILGAPVIIPMLGFSTTQAAALIGGILIAGEVIWFASIPLLGKAGFKEMKNKAFGILRLRNAAISKTRHSFGVGLLVTSIAVEALLIIYMVVAHLKLGSESAGAKIAGLDFQSQATVFVSIEILTAIGIISSVYLLGAGFAERLKLAFQWHGESGQV